MWLTYELRFAGFGNQEKSQDSGMLRCGAICQATSLSFFFYDATCRLAWFRRKGLIRLALIYCLQLLDIFTIRSHCCVPVGAFDFHLRQRFRSLESCQTTVVVMMRVEGEAFVSCPCNPLLNMRLTDLVSMKLMETSTNKKKIMKISPQMPTSISTRAQCKRVVKKTIPMAES